MSYPAPEAWTSTTSSSAKPGPSWLPVLLAASLALPWGACWLLAATPGPILTSFLSGLAILGAAFLLAWAAEAFQMDVSQAFALALLALIAVLPEYAVDAVFTWKSATDPAFASYPVANMTGANRLLIGFGWSAIVLMGWLRYGAHRVVLDRSNALELGVLTAATIYAISIPFKGSLSLVDTLALGAMFVFYAWATSRLPSEQPHLVGPAKAIGQLPTIRRRLATYALFLYAAAAIFISAKPFAEGLVHTGLSLGIDEFLLVQWLAPLASEAPEFLVAMLFAWRAQAIAALRVMVSSTVNQWTLLIATLPLVYSVAKGQPAAMPLDSRQIQEILLTAAQSAFALTLATRFVIGRWEALALFGLFGIQISLPTDAVRWTITWLYFALSGLITVRNPQTLRALKSLLRMVCGPFLGPQRESAKQQSAQDRHRDTNF